LLHRQIKAFNRDYLSSGAVDLLVAKYIGAHSELQSDAYIWPPLRLDRAPERGALSKIVAGQFDGNVPTDAELAQLAQIEVGTGSRFVAVGVCDQWVESVGRADLGV